MRFSSSLRGKLGLALLTLFVLVGSGVLLAVLRGAQSYSDEVNHRLNREAAGYIANSITPFKEDGSVDTDALGGVFMKVMVVNPTLEVYLIDTAGNVLAYDAPEDKIKRRRVDPALAQKYLDHDGAVMVLGEDPRSLDDRKPISVAAIKRDGQLAGYLYIILGGEAYAGIAGALQESYILRFGLLLIGAAFLIAALVGLGLLGSLTRPLERLRTGMQRFRDDGQAIALKVSAQDEIGALTADFNQMAERIATQVELLKVTDDERRRFVANISHDLRTPTATVQGYLETMLIKSEGLEPAERERYLRIALAQVKRLGSLIDDLFDLARLEARDVEPEFEPFDLAELASDVVAKFAVTAEAEERELRLVVAPESDYEVLGDVGLFERVFDNLLHNALKVGPRGSAVVVSVKRGLRAGQPMIEARVRDQGPGIAPAERERVFERFYRGVPVDKAHSLAESSAPKSTRHTVRGTGLGLAIVRRVVDLHGGQVMVEDLGPDERGASLLVSVPSLEK